MAESSRTAKAGTAKGHERNGDGVVNRKERREHRERRNGDGFGNREWTRMDADDIGARSMAPHGAGEHGVLTSTAC